jgi:hypothetical protein
MSDRLPSIPENDPAKKWFIQELWEEIRPRLLHFLIDLTQPLLMWIGIWVFHLVAEWMPIHGWVADFFKNMHNIAAVASFGIFIYLSLRRTWREDVNSKK